ncbi:hypothetical protein V1227_03355 [Lentzea sp. DG1S-22]|nr:hypothetical protein [Lentzea sp. DG1S-22]WVH84793.1 hypothetical protein V1227_03355 [Lentzea sp. DG1S-22]
MWADHRVQACATAVYGLRHPVVGPLAVTQQTRATELGRTPWSPPLCRVTLPRPRWITTCHYYFSVDQNQTSAEGRPQQRPPVTELPRRRTPADVRWTPAGARRR